MFLIMAYLFKFRSVAKREEVMKMDDNVWNDRDTDDFLRYLKFEYFMLAFMSTFAIMELICGFSNAEHVKIFGKNQ